MAVSVYERERPCTTTTLESTLATSSAANRLLPMPASPRMVTSTGRAVVNLIGNAVATVVMASMEGELDGNRMRRILSGAPLEDHPAGHASHGRLQCAPGETAPGTSSHGTSI